MKLIKLLLAVCLLHSVTNASAFTVTVNMHNIGTGTAYGAKCFWKSTSSPPPTYAGNQLGSFSGNLAPGNTSSSAPTGWTGGPYWAWTIYFLSQSDANSQVNAQVEGSWQWTPNANITLDVYVTPGGAAPTPKCYEAVVQNIGNGTVYIAGSVDNVLPTGTPAAVGPGGTFKVNYSDSGGTAHTLRLFNYKNYGEETQTYSTLWTGSTSTYNTNCPSASDVTITFDGYNFTKYETGNTNPPVDWSGSDTNSGLALESTLRKATEMLYIATREGNSQLHRDLGAILANDATRNSLLTTANGELGAIRVNTQATTNILGGVSGMLQSVTNQNGAQHVLDRTYLQAIMTNTANSAGSAGINSISNSTYQTWDLNKGIWVVTSNTWDRTKQIATDLNATLYNVKDSTASAVTHLNTISTKAASIDSSLDSIQAYTLDLKNDSTQIADEGFRSRTNLQAILSKATEFSSVLTNVFHSLGQSNLLTGEMLAKLSEMHLVETNMLDGIAFTRLNTQAATNLATALNGLVAAVSDKLATANTTQGEMLAKLNQIATNTFSANVTNNVSLTNNVSVSNYVNLQLTNNNMVTVVVSNNPVDTNMNLAGIITDATEASGTARSRVSAIETLENFGEYLGANGAVPFTAPDAPDMSITLGAGTFMEHTIDLNPVNKYPEIFALMRKGIMLLLTIGFVTMIWKLLWSAMNTFAGTDGGGIPTIGSPFEAVGNTFGVGVYLTVTIAVCALWAILLALFGTMAANAISDMMSRLDIFGGVSGIGLYLLNAAFPVSLMFGYIFAGLAFRFTAAGALAVAVIATKILPTK